LKIKQRSVPTSGIWGKVSPRFLPREMSKSWGSHLHWFSLKVFWSDGSLRSVLDLVFRPVHDDGDNIIMFSHRLGFLDLSVFRHPHGIWRLMIFSTTWSHRSLYLSVNLSPVTDITVLSVEESGGWTTGAIKFFESGMCSEMTISNVPPTEHPATYGTKTFL
jgi:hypothetical protein